jgi:hypothetical protein
VNADWARATRNAHTGGAAKNPFDYAQKLV